MRYLSVCSGIEAATVAWHPLGWQPAAFAEIEPFPSAVLAHHWPDVPNLGDMTEYHDWPERTGPIQLFVGGTPCQAFSVAGLRQGLADPRGNLTLTYLALVAQHRPTWVVWENVPGVLSDKTGAFGSLLGGLAELGYGWAYRVLDAQYFGLAQRRKRVFVVACLGNWAAAAAVLFERESLRWHPAPRRGPGKIAPTIPSRRLGGGGLGTDFDLDGGLIANPLRAQSADPHRADMGNYVAHTLKGEGFDGTGRCVAFQPRIARNGRGDMGDMVNALQAQSGGTGKGDAAPCIATPYAVRRLTPRECERLQGFPDDHTRIPWRGKPAGECPDGPRYKAIGNSMAVPVMAWLGRRIQLVHTLLQLP